MPSAARGVEGVVGRRDLFIVDPKSIIVKEGFNPRQHFDTERLEWLKKSIIENGVLEPIRIKKEGETLVLVDGERRLRATLLAIEEGNEIKGIPALLEQYKATEADLLISALIANDSEPLAAQDESKAYLRLLAWGWTHDAIAGKLGCSVVHVYNRLKLLELGEEATQALENKEITVTEAVQVAREAAKGEESQAVIVEKVKAKRERRRIERKEVAAITDPVAKVSFKLEVQMRPLLDEHGVLPLLQIMVKYSSKEEILDHLATLEE